MEQQWIEQYGYLEPVHDHSKAMASDLADLCDELGLVLYLVNGSLLGAARHKDIIPWDDDIDLGMMRSDYDKLIEFFKENGSYHNYTLYCAELDERCDLFFAKLVHHDQEELFLSEYFTHPEGLAIDIFPLDHAKNPDSLSHRLRGRYIKFLRMVIRSKIRVKSKVFSEPPLKRALRSICVIPFVGFSVRTLTLSGIRQMKKLDGIDTDYIVNFATPYNARKETNPKQYWLPSREVQLGNRFYKAPEKYEEILSRIYGSDWCCIPDDKKRYRHDHNEEMAGADQM